MTQPRGSAYPGFSDTCLLATKICDTIIHHRQQLQEELDVALRAREFLSKRSHWTRGRSYARGIFHWPVKREEATRACATGAAFLLGDPDGQGFGTPAYRLISRMNAIATRLTGDIVSVATFNDKFGHKAVLGLYDEAIAELRRELDIQSGLNEPSIPIQVPEPAREPRIVPAYPDPDPGPAPAEPAYDPEPEYVPEREPEKVPA